MNNQRIVIYESDGEQGFVTLPGSALQPGSRGHGAVMAGDRKTERCGGLGEETEGSGGLRE